ncbi:MAG: DNA gyrase subunit A [Fibrobacter sp.]|nr:DNA gyrase subunit A [Fibrobacter sp.]
MSENKFTPGTPIPSLIEKDMKDSYLRYSMSVIISRALPDVRDGLKPVHRRVLYGMHDLSVYPGKSYKKSARIVGDVIGKYHPHGDAAVYDTLVRMAQDFSLRYPLVDGQGNFGSIDGDSAAAMRYTEARMAHMGALLLEDLDKEIVDFQANYDESMEEPTVLPAVYPNLLVNGTTGIAVGMATNMPPHNLREITNAIKAVVANPEISDEELLPYVSGPDFPTGGIICGRSGIRDAYLTGRGRVVVRARFHTETFGKDRERLVITEIPYMVNKTNLLEKMADLVRDKRLEGISDIRDESDSKGMRVVIELRRDAVPEVVQNNLYKYTQCQETFGVNNLALVNREPKLLTLKQLIVHYVEHRHEIILRRTQLELKKAEARAHILEGLRIAQQNIDEVVRIIRNAPDTDIAKKTLQERFDLSEIQSQAIVDMRLRQLTGLEIEKIEKEYNDLLVVIANLKEILASRDRRMQIVIDRLEEVNNRFGDERRTAIEDAIEDFEIEDLIPEEEQVISLSKEGYIKRVHIDTFKSQGRGGRGVIGANLKDEDNIVSIFTASTHSFLLIFTDRGRVHWTKVYRIPEGARTGRGRPVVNLVELAEDENVTAIVPVRNFDEGFYLVMCTKNGIINKMSLEHFSRPRRTGVNAITLDSDDTLVSVLLAQDKTNLLIATRNGQAISFPPSAFRAMGRGTRGVRGIRLDDADYVIGMILLKEDTLVLTLTENGYAKRTVPSEYRVTNRGGKGVRNVQITEKTGKAVAVAAVLDDYDLIITSREGVVIRIPVESVRITGRSAQGVRAISLRDSDVVMDMAALPPMEDIEETPAEEQGENVTDAEIVENDSQAENSAENVGDSSHEDGSEDVESEDSAETETSEDED